MGGTFKNIYKRVGIWVGISISEGGNMKKIAILLCFILILTCFVGCSQSQTPSPDDPVTLTMWHVYGSQTKSPLNDTIDEFNNTVGKEKGRGREHRRF